MAVVRREENLESLVDVPWRRLADLARDGPRWGGEPPLDVPAMFVLLSGATA